MCLLIIYSTLFCEHHLGSTCTYDGQCKTHAADFLTERASIFILSISVVDEAPGAGENTGVEGSNLVLSPVESEYRSIACEETENEVC